MTTSASVDFSVSRDQIIALALQSLGIMSEVDTTESTSFTNNDDTCALWLNMLVKQWSGQSDFAPGLKMWSRKRAYLFLCGGQAVYTLGPTTTATGTTNKWASSYVTTTLTASSSSTTLTISSSTGMTAADRIGVQLASGVMQWTTISSVDSATGLTIGASVAAVSGNRVFTYTPANQGRRPLEILSAVLRDSNTKDVPMVKDMSVMDYERIGDKIADSDPTGFYYEQTLTDGTLYLNCEPSNITKVISMVYLSPIEDFDAADDTPDYDQNWYLPLVLGLEYLIAPMYGKSDMLPAIKLQRDEAVAIARNAIPETSEAYFQCN